MPSDMFLKNVAKYGKDFELEIRDQAAVNGQSREVFTVLPPTKRGIFKTPRGVKIFDDVNIEKQITHEIHFPYEPGVTSENWVRFRGRHIKILLVENCCENDDVLILSCTERGPDVANANQA